MLPVYWKSVMAAGLLIFLSGYSPAWPQPRAAAEFDDPMLNLTVVESRAYTEIAYASTPRIIEGAIGYQGYANDYVAFHSGLAFLASEAMDNLFGGLQAGLRVGLGRGFTPFAGVGAFIGYTEKTARDDLQNDAVSVSTDENKKVISDTIATVYPEAGLSIPVGRGYRVTISARRHLVSKGREFDFWSYSLGMTFRIQ